ncbi:MAG: LLM class F420-dependent oxidoreductase [Dehalococcoidia bacterium]|nr:LLM class F420-dependent oxidoreductase [Dehalococcoidia bacterium]MCB9486625.1 LLM class F420-dependent oxidoreductase [Thermoflexaceae bacterium]
MKFGIAMFPTDYAIPAHELARACEDLGFESLFFPEHTHIPTSRKSPWGGGAELPEQYWHTLDPFVAMAAAVVVTKDLKVGPGICLVVERDPITLAKEVASVDHLSGGRVLFGIGGGWNYEEMENHGTKPTLRWKIMKDRVQAMKAIWTQDEAEYHGEFVNFDPMWSWPKPVQKPYPPILIGGDGPRTLDRVIDYGDGWMPIYGRNQSDFGEKIATLQSRANEAGRSHIDISVFGAIPSAEVIEQLASQGVDRAIFVLPPVEASDALTRLKRYAEVKDAFRG